MEIILNNNEEAKKDCCICLDSIHTPQLQKLPCHTTHIFHKECISQWFEIKTNCPICRANFILPQTATITTQHHIQRRRTIIICCPCDLLLHPRLCFFSILLTIFSFVFITILYALKIKT